MMVRATGPEEFFAVFPVSNNIYGGESFYSATPAIGTCVRFFIGYKGDKAVMGMSAGLRDGVWYAPYSAPFTDIICSRELSIESVYDFFCELTAILDAPLHVTVPPDFYRYANANVIQGVLGNMARRCVFDYNYHYPCSQIGGYIEQLDRAARKNLNRALKSGFEFAVTDDLARAYAVISANRQSHGYPLAMSLERVSDTVARVPADFFLLSQDQTDVAAAIVYHSADRIAQVIYWGDAPGHSEERPMNMLAYNVFRHYYEAGFEYVDVGPASTNGIPNSGLCRFKTSVGCLTTIRRTFIIN